MKVSTKPQGISLRGSKHTPVLDTIVLFGAADKKDERHERSVSYMQKLVERDYHIACFALLEFDVVLKSRGYSFDDRMEKHGLLLKDFPVSRKKVLRLNPAVLYLTARLEKELGLDYFDAGVAAEALQFDGIVISTDEAFDNISHIKRLW